ncbi:hypothetical protein, partial [Thalassospira sp.]|uniref:hypothetical protein n=1 Tax=Thalassospira sp. TaxID=1912094 RepID=UPI00257B86C9
KIRFAPKSPRQNTGPSPAICTHIYKSADHGMRRQQSGPDSATFRMVIRRYRHTFWPAIIRIDKRCEFKWLTRCHFLAILAIQISVVLVSVPALIISTVRKPYPGIMAVTGRCPTGCELAFHIYESFLYKVRADVAAKSNSLGTLHY